MSFNTRYYRTINTKELIIIRDIMYFNKNTNNKNY